MFLVIRDFWGMRMQRSMGIARSRRALAWVVLSLPILALDVLIDGHSAVGQSAITLGSALDQPPASDSLLSSGSFRLDGPSEPPALGEMGSDPHAGVTTLGLQLYGSDGFAPHPAENEAPPVPSLGGSLARP